MNRNPPHLLSFGGPQVGGQVPRQLPWPAWLHPSTCATNSVLNRGLHPPGDRTAAVPLPGGASMCAAKSH